MGNVFTKTYAHSSRKFNKSFEKHVSRKGNAAWTRGYNWRTHVVDEIRKKSLCIIKTVDVFTRRTQIFHKPPLLAMLIINIVGKIYRQHIIIIIYSLLFLQTSYYGFIINVKDKFDLTVLNVLKNGFMGPSLQEVIKFITEIILLYHAISFVESETTTSNSGYLQTTSFIYSKEVFWRANNSSKTAIKFPRKTENVTFSLGTSTLFHRFLRFLLILS